MPSRISKNSTKKAGAKPGKVWQDKEVIEILVWGDLYLEIDPSWQKFNENIETHLRKACGSQRTVAQVHGKLNRLWRRWGREGPYDFPNLIKQEGSRCLEHPDFPWHEAVATRKKALGHDHFVAQLSVRTTRSASKTGGSSFPRSRSILYELVTSPSPRKKPRVGSASAISHAQGHSPTQTDEENLIQELSALGPIALVDQKGPHIPHGSTQRQEVIRDSFSDGSMDLDNAKEHGIGVSPSLSSKPELLAPTTKPSTILQTVSSITPWRISDLERQEDALDVGWLSRTRNAKLEARVAFLSIQLDDTKREADSYKQQLASLQSVQEACSKGLDLEHQLSDSKKKVKTLENTLYDRRVLHTFSSLTSTQPVPLDKSYIGSVMTKMGGEINGLARLDHARTCDLSTIAETQDFLELILRAFPGADATARQTSLMNRIPQSLRLKEVLRALVAAAVCSWVFDSPLDFLRSTSPCLVLHQYRRCLATQDRPSALRNLDFAAHGKLLDTELYHKQFVPSEARSLTTKLCEVFKPLFMQQELMGLGPRSSLYKPSDNVPDDVSSLQSIFECALEVKARLVLSTNAFEAVMYPPGTPLSRTRMKPMSRLGIPADVPLRQKPIIMCCFLPALIEHETSNQLLNHNNSIQSAQDERYQLKPFSQAAVLV